MPKPTLDAEAQIRRERDFEETVRMIIVRVGDDLPRLIELLRNVGIRQLAERLDALSISPADIDSTAEPALQ
jgi:hypothetical protein